MPLKLKTVAFGILGFFVVTGGYLAYRMFYTPFPESPTGTVTLEVESGDSFHTLGRQLVAKQMAWPQFNRLLKLVSTETLHEGSYVLDLPASTTEIVAQLNRQAEAHGQRLMANRPTAKQVTLKEGYSVLEVADELVAAGVLESSEEFLAAVTKPGQFEYAFLPRPLECSYGTRSNCVLYYLEGYLYPDTYEFFEDTPPAEIITRLLDNFERKVWSEYAGQVSPDELYKALTMASVIEVETGRPVGITGEDPGVLEAERRKVASVFYNRMEISMAWQSDPTVSYGLRAQVCQQTTKVEGCVYLNDARARTRYNTYQNPGYPIGPVSNPRLESIEAALNPASTEYLYFVADNRGVKRFAETDTEHYRNIKAVQTQSSE